MMKGTGHLFLSKWLQVWRHGNDSASAAAREVARHQGESPAARWLVPRGSHASGWEAALGASSVRSSRRRTSPRGSARGTGAG
jgi:hypothetical protein